MSDTRARSLAKSLSWRALATCTTFGIVLMFTGEVELAAAIGGVEVVAKLLIFYGHERVWERVRWGHALPAEANAAAGGSTGEGQSG